jgi:hypothetical protein
VPGLDPPNELVDLDASLDQMLRAKAARPLRPTMPLVVLSADLFPTELPPDLPPGYPDAATIARVARAAQNELAMILPCARHVIARRSGHYIHNAQPELVIDAVRRVLGMVRPAAVRCRGDGDSCRARVSLAGGAGNRKVAGERCRRRFGGGVGTAEAAPLVPPRQGEPLAGEGASARNSPPA